MLFFLIQFFALFICLDLLGTIKSMTSTTNNINRKISVSFKPHTVIIITLENFSLMWNNPLSKMLEMNWNFHLKNHFLRIESVEMLEQKKLKIHSKWIAFLVRSILKLFYREHSFKYLYLILPKNLCYPTNLIYFMNFSLVNMAHQTVYKIWPTMPNIFTV